MNTFKSIFDDYCRYYEYDKLVLELEKYNIGNKIIELVEKQEFQKLFDMAIEYGIKDLALYLYIHHSCIYNVDSYFTACHGHIASQEETDLTALSGKCSGSDGLVMEFWDGKSSGQQDVHRAIAQLRRFSKYFYTDKKYCYKMNPQKIRFVTCM